MQVMIWTELKKLRRSRMLLVALFGLCMVLVIVTAQGFFAGGNEAYGMEPEWYLTGVQSLGTMYALPGIIALFGSYIICRESQEDVLKSLLLIPVNMGKMVVAKVMVILVFSVGTYFVLFLAAFAVEMAFHAQVLTAAIFWHYLKNLFGGWNLRFLRSVAYYLLHYRKKAGLLAQPSGSGSLLPYHDLCGKPGNHIQTVSAGGCVHAFRVLRIHPGGNPAQCDFDGVVRYDIRHPDLSAEQKGRFAVKLWHQVLSEA